MTELFSIRQAIESDLAYINAYAFYESMDNMPGLENIFVAVNVDDIPVGFIRIAYSKLYDGVAYVNPIVTVSTWRGYGVGKALLKHAEGFADEMRLVARGSTKGFYEHEGYHEIPWDQVELSITENCGECSMVDECQPCPMGKIL